MSAGIAERIRDVKVEMLDRDGVLFASVLRSEEEWEAEQGFPLAMNIQREGVAL